MGEKQNPKSYDTELLILENLCKSELRFVLIFLAFFKNFLRWNMLYFMFVKITKSREKSIWIDISISIISCKKYLLKSESGYCLCNCVCNFKYVFAYVIFSSCVRLKRVIFLQTSSVLPESSAQFLKIHSRDQEIWVCLKGQSH